MIAYLNNNKIRNIHFHQNGGGSGASLDFSQIGYETPPSYLQSNLEYAKGIYDNWDASITDRGKKFSGDTKLVFCPAIDTSNVSNFYSFFYGCKNLEVVPELKISSNATNLQFMFYQCSGLTSLDVSNWNTSNVTTLHGTFNDCRSLTSLDVSNWNTSSVTSLYQCFYKCSGLTSLDVSNWNTSNVTSMESIFSQCSKLTSLDLSSWNTSKATSLYQCFYGCSGLTSLDVSNWNTSNVSAMTSIFEGCSGLTSLDLSSWDFSKIDVIQSYFYGCRNLKTLKLGNLNFVKSTTTTPRNLFYYCYELRKIEANNFINAPKLTSVEFSQSNNLGVNSDDVPDARQALTDTFVINSFDRASGGLSTCTLKFTATTKALFTDDEIAQITAKGYTIA